MTDEPLAADRVVRGRILTFDGPAVEDGHRLLQDGAIAVSRGLIAAVGEAAAILARTGAGVPVDDHRGRLVLPGLVDTHIHYPQTRVIAAAAAGVLEWLHRYTFVEEQRFFDPGHAERVAEFFLDELLRQGTTTAAVYCTVHPASVEAFFTASERRGTRMIAGKVMMDRNAPEALTDTADAGYHDSRALLTKWHGRGRQLYAITPRFAITSTPAQLEACGALAREFPSARIQTHLCENRDEIALVRQLYPSALSYADVYRRFGLLGERTILGHCIHLDDGEIDILARSRSVAAFCPTSNLFLGSGLFDLGRLRSHDPPVRVALATDVGGGTSYSMLRTADEAGKVLKYRGVQWTALAAFHMMTRGNAEALGLEGVIGSLAPGLEADMVVLDARATPAMAHRFERVDGLENELALLIALGDDRCVRETYVAGARRSGAVSRQSGP